jgi:hypothetical protein
MNMLTTWDPEITQELTDTERLLWAGQPRQGIVLRPSDAFMIPFSLFWGGFSLFWEAGVILEGAPWFFVLWGVPFVLVGLYLIAGRFLWDARRRSRTFYGLTDQRAIIVSNGTSRKVTSLNLKTLSEISLTEKSDGTGTITFGPMNLLAWWSGGTNWPGAPQGPPSFEMVQDAEEVYDILRQAQSEST